MLVPVTDSKGLSHSELFVLSGLAMHDSRFHLQLISHKHTLHIVGLICKFKIIIGLFSSRPDCNSTAENKKLVGGQVSRQVQTEMRKIQKKKLPASHVLERGQRQKHGESKRTHVERSGPNQRGSTLSDPQTAGTRPRPHTRGTKQSSR